MAWNLRNIITHPIDTWKGSVANPGGILGAPSTNTPTPMANPSVNQYANTPMAGPTQGPQQTQGPVNPGKLTNAVPNFAPVQIPGTSSGGSSAAIPQFQQVYNGTLYTDPQEYANAQQEALRQQQNSFNQNYNGTNYTNENDYYNAVIADAQKQHDTNKKSIETAYANGLISYADRQKALENNRTNISNQATDLLTNYQQGTDALNNSRDQALQAQAGMFAALSPDAYQSEQGNLANKVNTDYTNQMGNLNTTKSRNEEAIRQAQDSLTANENSLGQDKQSLESNYANNLKSIEDAITSVQDQIANAKSSKAATNTDQMQQLSDALANSILDFQNSVKAAQSSNSSAVKANTTTFDPVSASQQLAKYYDDAINAGFTPGQAAGATRSQLDQFDIPGQTKQAILDYLSGNNTKGSNYLNGVNGAYGPGY